MGLFNTVLFIILPITLYLSILHLPPTAASEDVLFPGDELNSRDSTSILLSTGGIFTLGFYTISSTNLSYLGIWYTNEQQHMKVWIGNRDIPITGDGILTIDGFGTLRVVNPTSGATIFNVTKNHKVTTGNNNTRAVLLDSGNFIVYDGANRTIWQSFDHPTNTLLPGMKIGYNHETGENWTLTSSADDNAPASGAFTLRLEEYQNSPQLLIYRRGELYWASGPWINATKTFQLLPSRFADTQFPYDLIISNPSIMYLIVRAVGSGTSAMQLSPMGEFIDTADSVVDVVNFCYGDGGFERHNGCAVSALPYCRNLTSRNEVYEWNHRSLINGPNKTDENSSISIGDCMERCWNDCDCVACSTYNNNGTGCIYWTEFKFSTDQESQDSRQAYVLYSSKYIKSQISNWMYFSLLIVPISVLAYVVLKKRIVKGKENRRREDFLHQMNGSNSFNYGDELERGIKDAPDVKIFSLKAILTATNNFSHENKLGQGGYGPVYRGELSDGREIAVKRLSKTSGQGILEFKSELVLISKLQHTNLVRLYGCCIHQEEKMLIYELIPNKSLDFFLFGKLPIDTFLIHYNGSSVDECT